MQSTSNSEVEEEVEFIRIGSLKCMARINGLNSSIKLRKASRMCLWRSLSRRFLHLSRMVVGFISIIITRTRQCLETRFTEYLSSTKRIKSWRRRPTMKTRSLITKITLEGLPRLHLKRIHSTSISEMVPTATPKEVTSPVLNKRGRQSHNRYKSDID